MLKVLSELKFNFLENFKILFTLFLLKFNFLFFLIFLDFFNRRYIRFKRLIFKNTWETEQVGVISSVGLIVWFYEG